MTTNDTKTKNIKVFTLRLEQDLFNKISEIANQSKRSISKQVEYMLDQLIKK